jgi:hypothetical protein
MDFFTTTSQNIPREEARAAALQHIAERVSLQRQIGDLYRALSRCSSGVDDYESAQLLSDIRSLKGQLADIDRSPCYTADGLTFCPPSQKAV